MIGKKERLRLRMLKKRKEAQEANPPSAPKDGFMDKLKLCIFGRKGEKVYDMELRKAKDTYTKIIATVSSQVKALKE